MKWSWLVLSVFFAVSAQAAPSANDDEREDAGTAPPTLLQEEVTVSDFKPSPRTMAVAMRWSLINLENFKPTADSSYGDIFGSSGPYLEIGWEKYIAQTRYGSVTSGISAGLLYDNGVREARGHEVTLAGFPIIGSVSYRMEFVERQLWIPFVRVGGGGWFYRQRSAQAEYNRSGFAPVMQVGAGAELLLDFFLWDYSRWMDKNFGINWTTITGEFIYTQGDEAALTNMTHTQINIGVRFDL